MLQSLREETEGKRLVLLSPGTNCLDSLFNEVRVFKVITIWITKAKAKVKFGLKSLREHECKVSSVPINITAKAKAKQYSWGIDFTLVSVATVSDAGIQESQIDPWPRYFWKVLRYTSHFYRETFAKVCPPSSWQKAVENAHRRRQHTLHIRVARLQNEVGTRYFFRAQNFSRKLLRNFPRSVWAFISWSEKILQNSRQVFPAKFLCKKSRNVHKRASAGAQGELHMSIDTSACWELWLLLSALPRSLGPALQPSGV